MTDTITGTMASSAHNDGSIIVLTVGSSNMAHFDVSTTRFKQAWWLGSATDNNAGTLVYDNAAEILVLAAVVTL